MPVFASLAVPDGPVVYALQVSALFVPLLYPMGLIALAVAVFGGSRRVLLGLAGGLCVGYLLYGLVLGLLHRPGERRPDADARPRAPLRAADDHRVPGLASLFIPRQPAKQFAIRTDDVAILWHEQVRHGEPFAFDSRRAA